MSCYGVMKVDTAEAEGCIMIEASHLPGDALRVWRINAAVRAGVIVCVVIGAMLLWPGVGWLQPWLLVAGIAVVLHALVMVVWVLRKRFISYRYRMEPGGFERSSGCLITRRLIVPANQVLFVELHQGPVSRSMGLKLLRIGTLGSTHDVGPLLAPDADALAAELSKWSRDEKV